MMYRKLFIIIGFLFLTNFSFSQEKPNVLFISVDDLKPMVGAYGKEYIYTPNMDRLANQGTIFLNTACQQAVCGPSRASLLTGLYPDQTEVYNLSTLIRDKNPDVTTLPQYFKNNGYTTTGAGKTFDPRSVDDNYDGVSWSIAYKHTMPIGYYNSQTGKGFRGFQNPQVPIDDAAYNQYLIDNNITISKDKNEAKKLFPFAKPSTESWDMPDDGYTDGARANFALEKLEELSNDSKPFFLAVGFAKPHLPFVAPKKYWDLYDRASITINPEQGRSTDVPEMAYHNSAELINNYSDIPWNGVLSEAKQKELIHGYRASVSYIDAQVGKLLDKLDDLGIANNTIIVLWGDHGWHLGDHNMWAKHSVFEQAVKSPLIIYSPKLGLANNVNISPVELIDIYPTLCELAGIEVAELLEGKSITALMEDPTAKVRDAALSQYPRTKNGLKYMGYSLRNDRYRYTKWIQMDYLNGERFGATGGVELYDYETDPYETINLAANSTYEAVINEFELLFKKRNIAQNTASSYLEVSICEGETFTAPDGAVYAASDIYSATISTALQQDSVITINLNVLLLPSNSVSLVEGELIAFEENASYFWKNCDTQEVVENEISQTFIPTETGNYLVHIVGENCEVISECYFVEITVPEPDSVITGLTVRSVKGLFTLYPNPIQNKLSVSLNSCYSFVKINIISLSGKVISSTSHNSIDQVMVDFNYPKGVYLIHVNADNFSSISKVFKN